MVRVMLFKNSSCEVQIMQLRSLGVIELFLIAMMYWALRYWSRMNIEL